MCNILQWGRLKENAIDRFAQHSKCDRNLQKEGQNSLFKPFQAKSHIRVHWEEPDSLEPFTLGISLLWLILP